MALNASGDQVDLPLATRLSRLGQETAFAVSQEARELGKKGHKIFSFHIGDLNFASPQKMKDALIAALNEGKTNYLASAGLLELRQAVARHCERERGIPYTADEVCIQPGGKPVIMKFLHAVMNAEDEVVIPTPGYPIYESVVRYMNGVPIPHTLKHSEDGSMQWDWVALRSRLTPKTKIFIWNDGHNPTGHLATDADRAEVCRIATEYNMWVLSDEAYFHMTYDVPVVPSIAAWPTMRDRTVILITASKSWASTGWRVGAAVGPRKVIDMFGKLTCNDESMTTNFAQWACIPAFDGECADDVAKLKEELRRRRDVLHELVNQVPGFSAPLPQSTFYMWVDVTVAMQILGTIAYEAFRKQILYDTKVSFCTREHFGVPLATERRKHIRLAFSGISCEDIKEAMAVLKEYMTAKAKEYYSLPRIFCTRQIPAKGLEMLRTRFALEVWPDEEPPTREILIEKAKDCDGLLTLLTDKIDEEFLSQCPKLKVISQMAVGYNNIDVAYCTRNGIAVTNTPDCLTETTAELTLALVLAVGRRIVEADHYVRDHKWKVEWHPSLLLGQDLHAHVYGIVGFGRIGQRVALLMKTLGAKIVYTDLVRRKDLEESFGVTYMDLEELIQASDFISVHCNLTKETRFLFDRKRIALMKPNCIFINTARGAIVDQKALTRALVERRIAGAGLDVFEREPISDDDPLLKLDNAVLVPHIGSASRDTREAMSTMAAEGLLSYFHGVGEIKHLVNREVLGGQLQGRGKPVPE